MGGLGLSGPCGQKNTRGSSLVAKFPIFFHGALSVASPYAVAPDQWEGSSVGEYCTVGVVGGGAF